MEQNVLEMRSAFSIRPSLVWDPAGVLKTMPVNVEQLPVPGIKLGEGPHWLENEQAIMYVDVFTKAIRRHFINTGRHQMLVVDDGGASETVTFVIPVEGKPDLFVIGVGNTISIVRWSVKDPDHMTVKPSVLQTVPIDDLATDDHFNDAKCDPRGRLWAGTMTPLDSKGEILEHNTSSLFRYSPEFEISRAVGKVTISNGLAWSHDRKKFYYIDSPAQNIYVFDYDDDKGEIHNQQLLLNYKEAGFNDQVPDGMSIDTDGNLWVACFGGGQVICVDPKQKKVINQISVPSKNVTSTCWGGPNYDILYATTGTLKLSPQEIASNPSAGGTFAISGTGAKGLPPANFKPNLEKLKVKMAS